MASKTELLEKIEQMALKDMSKARPGAIVVAEQFGWLRIALLLNVGDGGFQMTSRGKIVSDGGWFYGFDEMRPKNIFIMPIETEIADLRAVWPDDEWQRDIEKQWDDFFSKPEHKAIRDKYQQEMAL